MNKSDILKFSLVLNDGFEKEAMMAGLGRFAGRAMNAGGRAAGMLARPRSLPNLGVMGAVRTAGRDVMSGFREMRPGAVNTGAMHGPQAPAGYMRPQPGAQAWTAHDPMRGTSMQGPGSSPVPPARQLTFSPPNSGSPYDRFKTYWQSKTPAQKFGLGYGGATAASLPSNYNNNAHAEWQQQHPVMSWLGQNFGGMKKYNPHSYLLPSFFQG